MSTVPDISSNSVVIQLHILRTMVDQDLIIRF